MAAVDRQMLLDQLRGIRPPPIHSCHGDFFRALLLSASPSPEADEELQGRLHAAVAACCDAGRLDVDKAVPTLSADPREAKAAEDFLDFASSSPLLRVTWSGMPGIVLPEGVAEASLADVKASPPRYESDDTLYCSQPEIRQRIARGNSVLKVTYDDGRCESRMVLQSFRKFTGSLGDEDDDLKMAEGQHAADAAARGDKKAKPAMAPAAQSALRWKQFFLQPTSNVTSAVVMAKANGEAAHFSALRFGDHYLIICGSKNVHIAVSERGHIDAYSADRYRMATLIAHVIFDFLDALSSDRRLRILGFLAGSGLTATFELLQPEHMHVEILLNKAPKLVFLGWTMPDPAGASESLTLMHPGVGMQLAHSLGFDIVDFAIISTAELPEIEDHIRRLHGKEGAVIYHVNDKGDTVGMIKRKSVWYVVLRACREKLRSLVHKMAKISTANVDDAPRMIVVAQRRMTARVREIASWMCLSEEAVVHWTTLTTTFMEWVAYAILNGQSGILHARAPPAAAAASLPVTVARFEGAFPLVWSQFVDQTGVDDTFV